MAILKCKMCGGNIEIVSGSTVGVCNCCGTTTTLPKVDDDRVANLFNRANHFRMSGDFDKAATAYEHILEEDDSIAEAHWGAVLSKFGIEYVEDPDSHKRIPTCHRTSWDSILRDVDYLDALKYAEPNAKAVYEEEAKIIDNIQKGILSISKSEDPYDIFICYKETTDGGSRTKDSVLAQDLNDRLVKAGYRVFFSRITLEDKLGTQYEPYIFSALNSAKVMLVVGTSGDNFNAIWVKNEWSRFLQLCKKDDSKHLIPCYRDMDAYDMPEELSILQSQDMSKIGFEQDLLRGIEKIVGKNENVAAKQQNTNNGSNSTTAPLLERAFMFLEDGNWQRADDFCEQVLNKEPKNAQAYLGKLMAECRVHKQEKLKDCAMPFDQNANYQKVLRFGSPVLVDSLRSDIDYIRDRNETARKAAIYNKALEAMKTAKTEDDYKAIAAQLQSIAGFHNADSFAKENTAKAEAKHLEAERLMREAEEKAEELRKDVIYNSALDKMKTLQREYNERRVSSSWTHTSYYFVNQYKNVIKILDGIPGWRDVQAKIEICEKEIIQIPRREQEERAKTEAVEKANKRRKNIVLGVVAVCILSVTSMSILVGSILHHKCGDHLKWAYNESSATLTISGIGEMRNYYYLDDVPWKENRESIQTVILENGVTSIGDRAFDDCNSMISVSIPNSVETIGYAAFCGCDSLTSIRIPDSVITLGDSVFCNCRSLSSITIPDSVISIGNSLFMRCDSLTSVTIPASVSEFSSDMFYGCGGLTEIIVDENNKFLASLDGVLFSKDMTSLFQYPACKIGDTYSIPEGVAEIFDVAFYFCNNLTSVTIPDSVTHIGNKAFEGCNNLTNVFFKGNMAEWKKFADCFNGPVKCSDGTYQN